MTFLSSITTVLFACVVLCADVGMHTLVAFQQLKPISTRKLSTNSWVIVCVGVALTCSGVSAVKTRIIEGPDLSLAPAPRL